MADDAGGGGEMQEDRAVRYWVIHRVSGQPDQLIEVSTLREAAALAQVNLESLRDWWETRTFLGKWIANPHGHQTFLHRIRGVEDEDDPFEDEDNPHD